MGRAEDNAVEAACLLAHGHLVAARVECRREGFGLGVGLERHGPAEAGDMAELDRFLHVHSPIEDGDDRARDIGNDAGTAGRAHRHHRLPRRSENDRRRHRAPRALAAFDTIGDRPAVGFGPEGEVGELVVEEEAADHEPAAEAGLDAGGHRDDVALTIDDGEVARATTFRAGIRGQALGVAPGRVARLRFVHRPAAVDHLGAKHQVMRVEQTRDRHPHEVGIGHVEAAVGVGEARGFDEMVGEVGARAHARQVDMLEDAENLADGEAARGGWTHAAHIAAAIAGADGIAQLDLIAGEVGLGHDAGVDLGSGHGLDDGPGELAPIEGFRALLRDKPQGLGEGRILEGRPRLKRFALLVEEIGGGLVEGGEAAFHRPRNRGGKARRDLEARLGELGGGLDELRPGPAAEHAVRRLEELERSRHAHRAAADEGLPEGHGLAVILEEIVGAGGCRRGLAAVHGDEPLLGRIPVEQEGAAADARGLRFHQVQHELNGDHGVDGVAALGQDLVAEAGGVRVGRGHHEAFGGDRFRLRRRGRHGEKTQDRQMPSNHAVSSPIAPETAAYRPD